MQRFMSCLHKIKYEFLLSTVLQIRIFFLQKMVIGLLKVVHPLNINRHAKCHGPTLTRASSTCTSMLEHPPNRNSWSNGIKMNGVLSEWQNLTDEFHKNLLTASKAIRKYRRTEWSRLSFLLKGSRIKIHGFIVVIRLTYCSIVSKFLLTSGNPSAFMNMIRCTFITLNSASREQKQPNTGIYKARCLLLCTYFGPSRWHAMAEAYASCTRDIGGPVVENINSVNPGHSGW
jgi:hypothetical protein